MRHSALSHVELFLRESLVAYSVLFPSKTFNFPPCLYNLFPYYPRLLEPWISTELSFLELGY
jgi:hypothetical protein